MSITSFRFLLYALALYYTIPRRGGRAEADLAQLWERRAEKYYEQKKEAER